jgi:drug/metabolite transporter (DMT)-like permease
MKLIDTFVRSVMALVSQITGKPPNERTSPEPLTGQGTWQGTWQSQARTISRWIRRRIHQLPDNTKGILAMLAAMALFVFGDALMKLSAASVPTGESIFLRGVIAVTVIWILVIRSSAIHSLKDATSKFMLIRAGGDMGGAVFFQTALGRLPFADVTAVLQINPLVVTAGAALFLNEKVGWRRWTATAIGLCGALLIIKPGSSTFNPWSLLLILAVLCAATRDLATRQITQATPSVLIIAVSTTFIMLSGLAHAPFETWTVPTLPMMIRFACAAFFMLSAQYCVVTSIRTGDISAVVPFRYSAILWSLLLSYLIWNDVPDRWTMLGIAIIASAGLYVFFREQKLRQIAAAGRAAS